MKRTGTIRVLANALAVAAHRKPDLPNPDYSRLRATGLRSRRIAATGSESRRKVCFFVTRHKPVADTCCVRTRQSRESSELRRICISGVHWKRHLLLCSRTSFEPRGLLDGNTPVVHTNAMPGYCRSSSPRQTTFVLVIRSCMAR